MNSNIFLSPHFCLKEFTESSIAEKRGIVNEAPPDAVVCLIQLCQHTLEPLRTALELPVIINSGYRCEKLNNIIANHACRSQHLKGQAADFYVGSVPEPGSKFQDSGFKTPRERLIQAFRLIIESPDIDFDQLIIYPTFIHVSYASHDANRHYIMKANGCGKYTRLTREVALTLT